MRLLARDKEGRGTPTRGVVGSAPPGWALRRRPPPCARPEHPRGTAWARRRRQDGLGATGWFPGRTLEVSGRGPPQHPGGGGWPGGMRPTGWRAPAPAPAAHDVGPQTRRRSGGHAAAPRKFLVLCAALRNINRAGPAVLYGPRTLAILLRPRSMAAPPGPDGAAPTRRARPVCARRRSVSLGGAAAVCGI